MLLQQLKMERTRIFAVKWNIVFLVLFSAVSFVFIYSGFNGYNHFNKEMSLLENQEINTFTTGGLQVFYEPSPLSLFFPNSYVFNNLTARVNNEGKINVFGTYKASNLLMQRGSVKDLAGLFFIFASLFMTYMGLTAYKSERIFFSFENVLIRLLILEFLFGIILFSMYWFSRLIGSYFSDEEAKAFLYFSLFLLLLLSFFYAVGLLIRVITGSKSDGYLWIVVFWLTAVFIIPEMMGYPLNQRSLSSTSSVKEITDQIDSNMLGQDNGHKLKKVLSRYEKIVLLFPTGFFKYFSGEISSQGYGGYLALVKYTKSLKINLASSSLEKTFSGYNQRKILKGGVVLPKGLFLATLLTGFYVLVLFSISFLLIRNRKQRIPVIEKPDYKFRKGNSYFVLCENAHFKDELFGWYLGDKAVACLLDVSEEELDQGVQLSQLVTHFCDFLKIDREKVMENLRHLGILADNVSKGTRIIDDQRGEMVITIYYAVVMAAQQEVIVVDDFLKGKSRDLERQFLYLVEQLNRSGKIVVYLSCEMFATAMPLEGEIKIESHRGFKIDPQAVSLR
jgi:hypothetical protein